jgi:hypothetical protein
VKPIVTGNEWPDEIASNPSSVPPSRRDVGYLHDKLRLVEGSVKWDAKRGGLTMNRKHENEPKYSLDQRFRSTEPRPCFRRISAVYPPLPRRKSTTFCTPFSGQIHRFSASFPHDLHMISIADNPHSFSARFSQEIAAPLQRKMAKSRRIGASAEKDVKPIAWPRQKGFPLTAQSGERWPCQRSLHREESGGMAAALQICQFSRKVESPVPLSIEEMKGMTAPVPPVTVNSTVMLCRSPNEARFAPSTVLAMLPISRN